MSPKPIEEKTWIDVFAEHVKEKPNATALMTKESGSWEDIRWTEFDKRVRAFARALLANGFEKGEGVAVLASNRWQWGVADLGTVHAGGIGTGIYPTNSPEQCEYILNHSGSRYILCDTAEQTEKILSIFDKLASLRKIVTLDKSIKAANAVHWDDWIASGEAKREEADALLADRIANAKPDDVVMFVYTSGTTGPPKCVQLAHNNTLPGLDLAAPYFDHTPNDVGISYLPPAHVADRVGAFYLSLYYGTTLAYVSKVEEMMPAMTEVRPHAMVWVPRIYEKVYTKINAGIAEAPAAKQKVFNFALNTGKATAPYRMKNQPIPFPLSLKHKLAKKLLYDKINEKLLGGRLRYFLSGAAPLSKEVAEFFFNLNIPIYETWSMSETSALATVNRPGFTKYGSVGQPLPMCDIKIDEDGEILIKGPNVMRGYYKNEEATKEAFTPDGFLRTGDIGKFDEDGFLYITDRKKDLIVTSSGKNIAPQNIENQLKQSRWISLALAHGNNRNFVTALITLDAEEIEVWAKENGLEGKSVEELAQNEKTNALIQEAVDATNTKLARVEQIKKFKILPRDFLVDEGEITPTLKLKRKVIEQKYKETLDGFYQGG